MLHELLREATLAIRSMQSCTLRPGVARALAGRTQWHMPERDRVVSRVPRREILVRWWCGAGTARGEREHVRECHRECLMHARERAIRVAYVHTCRWTLRSLILSMPTGPWPRGQSYSCTPKACPAWLMSWLTSAVVNDSVVRRWAKSQLTSQCSAVAWHL
jgi:hypothetical protein